MPTYKGVANSFRMRTPTARLSSARHGEANSARSAATANHFPVQSQRALQPRAHLAGTDALRPASYTAGGAIPLSRGRAWC